MFLLELSIGWWSLSLAMCTTLAPVLLLRISHLYAGLHSFIVMLGDVKWHFLIPPTLINARALLVALIYNDTSRGSHYSRYW
ncbi:HPP family protein [Psychrobacter immobilis]|uniref:HPP family protein n=1 Tax=Psychrobacter immobilis TaxID=498 RepID=UPI00313FFDB5